MFPKIIRACFNGNAPRAVLCLSGFANASGSKHLEKPCVNQQCSGELQ